jgi:hypothetical protein
MMLRAVETHRLAQGQARSACRGLPGARARAQGRLRPTLRAVARDGRQSITSGDKRSMREWIDNEMEKRHDKELNKAIRHIAARRAELLQERRKKLDEIAMVRAKHYERPSH